MKLTKRQPLHPAAFSKRHHAARAFHAPQREHVAKVQHPKPMCGMCGGKIHTRTNYRAPGEWYDPTTGRTGERPGDPGWWLCPSCDTGPEVGMPRAA